MNQTKEEKKPIERFNDSEMGLIRNTFAGNDELINLVRKFFLQSPSIKAEELSLLRSKFTATSELFKLLKKTLYPELDFDMPPSQNTDLWLNVDVTKVPEYSVKARQIMIRYIAFMFDVLANGDKATKTPVYLKDLLIEDESEKLLYSVLARNEIVKHIEYQMLLQIKVFANREEKTKEELAIQNAKNSNK